MAIKFHFHIPVTLASCCVIVPSRFFQGGGGLLKIGLSFGNLLYIKQKKSAILQQQSEKKTAGTKVQVKVVLYLKRSVFPGMILDSLFQFCRDNLLLLIIAVIT